MIRIPGPPIRLCEGLSRRDLLKVGALGWLGLPLPELLRVQETKAAASSRPKADACILLFLWGAPSQFETFDPKPDAPSGIRGEFGVIRTNVPGTVVGEHIPLLARRADRYAIVRTCTQSSTHHQSAGYEALTGFPPTRDAVSLTATPSDHPNMGSVVSRFTRAIAYPGNGKNQRGAMPPFVTLPQLISDVGNPTPGQFAGYLGRKYDPLAITKDPSAPDFSVDELTLLPEVSASRLGGRRTLLREVDAQIRYLNESAETKALNTFQDRAIHLLTSPAVRQAFDLSHEPAVLRDRYGRNSFGQSCLLARRLVEAGVKLVTVYSACGGKIPQDAWDTHADNFRKLKNQLLPPMDQGASALLDDLDQRGLTDRTLLIWMGEFGRTPKINPQAGRDHWANSYTIWMAGAGVRPGQVYGRSDRSGAYPVQGRVFTPADICATIYDCLGIDYRAEVIDPLSRLLRICEGKPMLELF